MKNNVIYVAWRPKAVEQVVEQGQSLSNILPPLQQKVSDKDKALLQELCFGVLRTLSQLDWLINKLMARPMTGKQRTVHYLIMVGLYQLLYTAFHLMLRWLKRLKALSQLSVRNLKG